jgi:hypothetical protein
MVAEEVRANELGRGTRSGAGKRGKSARNRKKMFFRGNELSYLLQTQELMFLEGKNELVFECKKGQTNSKNEQGFIYFGVERSENPRSRCPVLS